MERALNSPAAPLPLAALRSLAGCLCRRLRRGPRTQRAHGSLKTPEIDFCRHVVFCSGLAKLHIAAGIELPNWRMLVGLICSIAKQANNALPVDICHVLLL